MQAIILGCGSLLSHIEAAQAKMQTDFPVVELDRKYHVDPRQMQQEILTKLQQLPAEVDTVLVAMGVCGGSAAAPLRAARRGAGGGDFPLLVC